MKSINKFDSVTNKEDGFEMLHLFAFKCICESDYLFLQ
jgi:hypothetical protein